MEFKDVLEYVLPACGVLAIYILNRLSNSLDKATTSVGELNEKMAVIVEKVTRHDKEIEESKETITLLRERTHALGNEINKLQIHLER